MRMREGGRLAGRHKVGSAVVCQEGEEEDGFELQGWNSGILSAAPSQGPSMRDCPMEADEALKWIQNYFQR